MADAWKEPVRRLAMNGQMTQALRTWQEITGDGEAAARRGIQALLTSSVASVAVGEGPAAASAWSGQTLASARFGEGKGAAESYQPGQIWLGRTLEPEAEAVGFSDDRHVVTIAGSRAGKGTMAVVPNLCNYPGSVICVDPKGENATVTARRRGPGSAYAEGLGQQVAVLDPFGVADVPEELRARFNPLDLLDLDGPDAIDEAKAIAEAIVVSDDPRDMHWTDSARQWVAALVLYAKATGVGADLDGVRLMLTRGLPVDPEDVGADGTPLTSLQVLLRSMKDCPAAHGAIAAAAETLDGMGTEERGNVLSFARRNTAFLDSPRLKEVTGASTFTLDALKTSPQGLSIYLCLPVKELSNHGRWFRLMVMLAMSQMEKLGHRPPATGHPVLFMLDEFPALGYMRSIEQAAGYIAGFGVKLWVILQDLQQLQSHYKRSWSTFLANAGVLQCFGNNDQVTLEYLSKRLGERQATQYTTTRSLSQSQSESVSTNYSNTSGTASSVSADKSVTRAPRGLIFKGKRLSENTGSSRTRSTEASTSTGGGQDQSWSEERGESRSELITVVPLLRPDEIERQFNARSGLQLIIVSGDFPLILRCAKYFEDAEFEGKYDPHPAHPDRVPMTLAEREQLRLQALAAAEAARAELAAAAAARPPALPLAPRRRAGRYIALASFLAAAVVLRNWLSDAGAPAGPPPPAPAQERSATSVAEALARVPPAPTPTTVLLPVPATAPTPAPARYAVAAVGANVRAAPTEGSEVLTQLGRGSLVTVLEHADSYVRVRTASGTDGWMSERLLIEAQDLERLQSTTPVDYVKSRDVNARLSELRSELRAIRSRVEQLQQAMHQRSAQVDSLVQAVGAERSISLQRDASASLWFLWSAQVERDAGNWKGQAWNALAGIAADPANPEHHVAYGLAQYQMRDFAQLGIVANFLPYLAPEATNTWMLVGLSHAMHDRTEEATTAFVYALALSKNPQRTRRYFETLAQEAPDSRIANAVRSATNPMR